MRAEEIAESLEMAIAERRLRPGTRLKETELAEIYGVSRARVRLALARLTQEGLVETLPNRGASVASPRPDEAADVFHLRHAVEARLLARLMPRLDATKLDRLQRHIAKERLAIAARNPREILRLSGGFHLLLADLAEAGFLAGVLRDLVARSALISAAFRPLDRVNCGPEEHAQILQHLRSGDLAAAQAALAHHLDHLEAELQIGPEMTAGQSLREMLLSAPPGRL